jgi:magnesium transporter
MPELEWPYGYVAVLALMSAVAGGMVSFFWRRGWIGRAWRLRSGKAAQRQESAK